ncbi:MAG: hypothetical protein IJ719_19585 [Clostridia bacterium]|nr:hypothetical protein [Clostridia bacterium]
MSTVDTEKVMNSKAVVMGCACVIFSSLTPDEIRTFKNLHPEALKMTDEEKNVIFSIGIDDGPGHISEEAAVFSSVTSADGKATITVLLDPSVENPVTLVEEKIGCPLMHLIEQEEKLMELLPKLSDEKKAISQHITQL